MVYFAWKGIDVVRSYVVPANPKSTAQQLQRGYLTAAVAKLHVAQANAANPFNGEDAIAYALLGSLQPTPRTWFNTVVRQWLKQKVAGKLPLIYHDGSCVGGSTKLTVTMHLLVESSLVTDGTLNYGTRKSALINSIACTRAALGAGKDIPGLTAGTKYYVQFRPTLPTTFLGSNSGIWYGVPTA